MTTLVCADRHLWPLAKDHARLRVHLDDLGPIQEAKKAVPPRRITAFDVTVEIFEHWAFK